MRLFGIDGRLAPYYTGACWRLGLAFGLPICALVGLAVGMGHGIESIILQVTVCVVGLVVIYGVVTDVWPIIAWLRCATCSIGW